MTENRFFAVRLMLTTCLIAVSCFVIKQIYDRIQLNRYITHAQSQGLVVQTSQKSYLPASLYGQLPREITHWFDAHPHAVTFQIEKQQRFDPIEVALQIIPLIDQFPQKQCVTSCQVGQHSYPACNPALFKHLAKWPRVEKISLLKSPFLEEIPREQFEVVSRLISQIEYAMWFERIGQPPNHQVFEIQRELQKLQETRHH
ncbi:hypothetical protein A6X21_03480 [Planctopirus hydrillae]|uniref:Uncharacterized protein n=2 Tax=Planctopirus hydrillae TaxID=1841610 RepID=A0A1C3END1_9PLAN|nr:hypothetical protein A6X21_03480 [Planctopirus hydrillae]